ncbi:Proto-oncogene tyrosine-protein kinase receptor Ret [Strongyloides ratti]|uniref:Proto-oncogene tyrosine-protein kinase receptor Ret n=1 Tax=Strongyloides ratti TaxID=34506 RepID=A0A090KV77_STRRB|nr:Proto-oncogene tyrosine-protein kinase receptor Ret [Strongyloides ratti]CEF59745.1 Proto-oncogene tyrosine-protein kinase receptor Ret [Strongyloides ratti]
MVITFNFLISIIFCQSIVNTVLSNLLDDTKEHCQDLQCMKKIFIDSKHQLVHDDGTTETCISCDQCYNSGFSVCMKKKVFTVTRGGRNDDEKICSCFNSVPEECRIQPQGPPGYNGAFKGIYNICYYSSIKNPPQPLAVNTEKSIIVTISPFWTEPYWKDFQLTNLTLIYEYPIQSPEQCEREITTNLNGEPKHSCTGTVDINMKSEDIADNTDYNPIDLFSEGVEPTYDDLSNELPPEVEFDREVFAGAHNVKLWMTVTVKRGRQLISNTNTSNIFKNVNTVLSSNIFNFDLQPEIYGTEGRVESNEDDEDEKENESENTLLNKYNTTTTTVSPIVKEDENIMKTKIVSKEDNIKEEDNSKEIQEESKETETSEEDTSNDNTSDENKLVNDDNDGNDDGNNDNKSFDGTSLPEIQSLDEYNDDKSSEDNSTIQPSFEDENKINIKENKTIDDESIVENDNNTTSNNTSVVTNLINNVISYLSFTEELELSRIVFAGCVVLCLIMLCCTCLCRSKLLCCKNRNGDYDKVNNSEFSRNNTQEMLNSNNEQICKPLIESSSKLEKTDCYDNSIKVENSKLSTSDIVSKNNTLRLKQLYQKQYKELISSSPTLDYKRLRLDEIIGDGNFGVVLRQAVLQDLEDAGKIKEVITCSSHKFDKFHNHELDSFLNALAVSVRAKTHPNIVSLIAVDEQFENLLLIFENFNYPDLLTTLRESRKQKISNTRYAAELTPIELCRIMIDCARGTGHLIKSKILHSMLAACNVIVLPNRTVKIAGFGFAEQRQLHCNQYEPKPGPERWQSPEILIPKIYKDTNSKIAQSMIWSLGILLWETASLGGTPFEMYATNEEFIEAIFLQKAMLTMPAHCSVELLSIFHTCVQYDLVLRPETTDAIVRKLEILQSDADNHINLTTTNPGEMFYFPPINTRLEQITARF